MNEPGRGSSRSWRWIGACLGAVFLAAAIVIVVQGLPGPSAGEIVAALVLGGLGLDAVISALRDRRSLLERIGPLP
jgi:uncharacterized membrane protein YdcZ (DUF606 family)